LLASLVLGSFGCNGDPTAPDAAEPAPDAAETPEVAEIAPAGEVAAISGPGGLSSPALEPGTFLGKGGQLVEGQAVETPRGTLAELQLRGGVRVRLNENTAIKLPTGDGAPLTLTRGEVVIVAAAGEAAEALTVAAGDETFVVNGGEAQARNTGSSRHYSVVFGTAKLLTGGKTLELGAGESIEAPLPADEPKPELSLAPLRDTNWSRTFEAAAHMADSVPRGIGSLTARRPGASSEKQKRLRLADQKVTVSITGRVAYTEVEQAFFNDEAAVLEGIYRFPLPSDGSVSGLSLLVGNRWMDGEVVEKQRARAIFKEIVDATIPRDPALLEWEQGNIFKLRIFPIPGRGERRIRLSYTQVLPAVGDSLRYRFPLAGSGAGGTEIDNFAFTVNVDRSELDEAQVAEIGTPMLPLTRSDDGDVVSLSTKVEHFVPSYDIGVDLPLPPDAQRTHVATHLDRDGQAYFMLTMRPDWEMQPPTGATHYAFVVDRSHSVAPELWTVARGVVEAMTANMTAEDRFTVMACDTACDVMPGGLRSADAATTAQVQEFLGDQDLAGASDIGGMLTEAALALDAEGAAAQQVIVYLGDGAPSSGELAADKLAKLVREPLRSSRVMAVAMGARSDLTTLGAIVEATGGDIVPVDARDDIQHLVRELQLRGQVPVARDLEVDVPDGMTAVRMLDRAGLREGDSVVLTGKLRHPVDGEVVVRARGPRGPVETRFPIKMTADRSTTSTHRHLPRTWAAQQIQHLTKTQGFDARDSIIELSKQYTVMSRFTSLLVLENDEMFREFNVVRAAKDTDKWDGKLETERSAGSTATSADKAKDISAGATGTETRKTAEAGEKVLEEDLPDDGTRRPGQAPTTTATPDPDPAARRLRSQSGPTSGFDPAPPAPPADEPEPEPSFDSPGFGDDNGGGGDVSFEDDDHDDVFGEVIGGAVEDEKKGNSAGKSKDAPSPKPAPTTKRPSNRDAPAKPSKKKSSAPKADMPAEPGGGVVGGWGGGRGRWREPTRTLATKLLAAPDSAALARVDERARLVAADPTRRTPHGQLVRSAIRAGHRDSVEFARAWAEVDPDHAPALLSLADMLAAEGDPMALRAYESAVEVRPFDKSQHESLARAFDTKGDHTRACSHRRAVVSIDPTRAEHHAELARCLQRAGRVRDARDIVSDGRARAKGSTKALNAVEAQLASGVAAPAVTLPRGGQLRATLTWAGEDDLDIVVVDANGRRLSSMRPESKLDVLESRGREELVMSRVGKSVFLEITRAGVPIDDPRRRSTTTATLEIKAGSSTKRVPVEITGGSVRVAQVAWKTTRGGWR
jgi:hypothetical protein